ncbi:hypothetical protein BB561_001279 [Smittium simulii]|uniref:Uncharacterized protein n=1 Tax=Smittium simulii TaxID=133385 RepID=A0A2T9YVE2_9FUNG|nr:hypothetical protein BB561_001279 [Smittium simulii]
MGCSTDITFKIQNQLIPPVNDINIWELNVMINGTTKLLKVIWDVIAFSIETESKCGKSAAMVRLRQELSLTDLNIKTAVARTRAFGKWASLRTWISDLIKCPYKHRCDTWAGTSCNWMGLELVYPELKTHINYVFKIRNGTYWTARRYAKSGFIEKRFSEECPFCSNIAPETIEHMLLECSRWQVLQADILAQYINIYRAQVAATPLLLPASLKLSSTRIRKDPTVLCVKITLATAKFLNTIALPRYLILNSIMSTVNDKHFIIYQLRKTLEQNESALGIDASAISTQFEAEIDSLSQYYVKRQVKTFGFGTLPNYNILQQDDAFMNKHEHYQSDRDSLSSSFSPGLRTTFDHRTDLELKSEMNPFALNTKVRNNLQHYKMDTFYEKQNTPIIAAADIPNNQPKPLHNQNNAQPANINKFKIKTPLLKQKSQPFVTFNDKNRVKPPLPRKYSDFAESPLKITSTDLHSFNSKDQIFKNTNLAANNGPNTISKIPKLKQKLVGLGLGLGLGNSNVSSARKISATALSADSNSNLSIKQLVNFNNNKPNKLTRDPTKKKSFRDLTPNLQNHSSTNQNHIKSSRSSSANNSDFNSLDFNLLTRDAYLGDESYVEIQFENHHLSANNTDSHTRPNATLNYTNNSNINSNGNFAFPPSDHLLEPKIPSTNQNINNDINSPKNLINYSDLANIDSQNHSDFPKSKPVNKIRSSSVFNSNNQIQPHSIYIPKLQHLGSGRASASTDLKNSSNLVIPMTETITQNIKLSDKSLPNSESRSNFFHKFQSKSITQINTDSKSDGICSVNTEYLPKENIGSPNTDQTIQTLKHKRSMTCPLVSFDGSPKGFKGEYSQDIELEQASEQFFELPLVPLSGLLQHQTDSTFNQVNSNYSSSFLLPDYYINNHNAPTIETEKVTFPSSNSLDISLNYEKKPSFETVIKKNSKKSRDNRNINFYQKYSIDSFSPEKIHQNELDSFEKFNLYGPEKDPTDSGISKAQDFTPESSSYSSKLASEQYENKNISKLKNQNLSTENSPELLISDTSSNRSSLNNPSKRTISIHRYLPKRGTMRAIRPISLMYSSVSSDDELEYIIDLPQTHSKAQNSYNEYLNSFEFSEKHNSGLIDRQPNKSELNRLDLEYEALLKTPSAKLNYTNGNKPYNSGNLNSEGIGHEISSDGKSNAAGKNLTSNHSNTDFNNFIKYSEYKNISSNEPQDLSIIDNFSGNLNNNHLLNADQNTFCDGVDNSIGLGISLVSNPKPEGHSNINSILAENMDNLSTNSNVQSTKHVRYSVINSQQNSDFSFSSNEYCRSKSLDYANLNSNKDISSGINAIPKMHNTSSVHDFMELYNEYFRTKAQLNKPAKPSYFVGNEHYKLETDNLSLNQDITDDNFVPIISCSKSIDTSLDIIEQGDSNLMIEGEYNNMDESNIETKTQQHNLKSLLTLKLCEYEQVEGRNPFASEYRKHQGQNNSKLSAKVKIFLHSTVPTLDNIVDETDSASFGSAARGVRSERNKSSNKIDSFDIELNKSATTEQAIGYALYVYIENLFEKYFVNNKLDSNDKDNTSYLTVGFSEEMATVGYWDLRIADFDGEIDDDFPLLGRSKSLMNFGVSEFVLCKGNDEQIMQNKQKLLEQEYEKRQKEEQKQKDADKVEQIGTGKIELYGRNAIFRLERNLSINRQHNKYKYKRGDGEIEEASNADGKVHTKQKQESYYNNYIKGVGVTRLLKINMYTSTEPEFDNGDGIKSGNEVIKNMLGGGNWISAGPPAVGIDGGAGAKCVDELNIDSGGNTGPIINPAQHKTVGKPGVIPQLSRAMVSKIMEIQLLETVYGVLLQVCSKYGFSEREYMLTKASNPLNYLEPSTIINALGENEELCLLPAKLVNRVEKKGGGEFGGLGAVSVAKRDILDGHAVQGKTIENEAISDKRGAIAEKGNVGQSSSGILSTKMMQSKAMKLESNMLSVRENKDSCRSFLVTRRIQLFSKYEEQLVIEGDFLAMIAVGRQTNVSSAITFHIDEVIVKKFNKGIGKKLKLVVTKLGSKKTYEIEASSAHEAQEIVELIDRLKQRYALQKEYY